MLSSKLNVAVVPVAKARASKSRAAAVVVRAQASKEEATASRRAALGGFAVSARRAGLLAPRSCDGVVAPRYAWRPLD